MSEVRKAKRKVEGNLAPEDVKKGKDELREAQKNVRDYINETNAAEGERVLVRKPIQEKTYEGERAEKSLPKWLTDVDEDGRIDVKKFKQALDNGEVDTTIFTNQQVKHQSTPQWRNQVKQALQNNSSPKSRLYNHIDPQLVVDNYCGTGILQSRKGNKCVDEFVSLPYPVGVSYDKKVGKYVPTSRVQIKYTKDGTHVIPVLERRK